MPATNAFADYALQLHLKDGSLQTFLIASKPSLTIVDGTLFIKSGQTEFSCQLGQVDYYDFPSDIDPTKVETIDSQATIQMNGDCICFSGLNGNAKVAVYTADGKKIRNITTDGQGNVTIDISSLPQGIYVINVGNYSTKVIKK